MLYIGNHTSSSKGYASHGVADAEKRRKYPLLFLPGIPEVGKRKRLIHLM